ncbi:tol-pal system YbgF family protein [Algoriphagus sp. A40]|uniref:tetratricopeptide repeat protein n=1 Tax=Algoriphagus sp. A40 TaxID=1945863 RepID=UPI00143AEE7F|nr:tetratricopeptide repeat protein [Algoriphagus sp. A40]
MKLEELFDSFLGGKMSESDRILFEKLLEENPEYQSQLNTYRQLKIQTGKETESSDLPSKSKNLKNWLIPIAIALLIVLVGYFLFSTLSMSPGQKLFAKYYETYPIADTGTNASGDASQAFQAYEAKDYQKAAAFFERIQTQPNSDFALLYLGICQLELGRPEKAIPVLSLIPTNSPTASKEVASWFEALGYFKLNMLDKGKKALQVTAAKPNPYQTQAKTILESLD